MATKAWTNDEIREDDEWGQENGEMIKPSSELYFHEKQRGKLKIICQTWVYGSLDNKNIEEWVPDISKFQEDANEII